MKAVLNNRIRRLLVIMAILVVVAVVIAKTYYGNLNRSVDPRIVKARELYASYDRYAQEGDYFRIFSLLDSIETIYLSQIHYTSAYERGVLYNNRAAALLTIIFYGDQIPDKLNPYWELPKDSLIALAELAALTSISIYEKWNLRFDTIPVDLITEVIEDEFLPGIEDIPLDLQTRYLSYRVKEIERSLPENARRLSVSHTNYGMIFRLKGDHLGAVRQYEKALELWDRNLEAENNLNRLLGRPLKKRNFIQRLFPPDRGKE